MKLSEKRSWAREPFCIQKKNEENVSLLYDNSLTNRINEDSVLHQHESLETLWHQGKMNCIIPYKYDDSNTNNCSDNTTISQRMNAFKVRLSEVMKPDTSADDLKRGLEKGLFEDSDPLISIKNISKTLSGWDGHGIHYLLSKINNQHSGYLLPRGTFQYPARSLIHIHACESCNDKFYNNFSIYSTSICLNDCIDIESYHNNYNTLLLQEKGLIPYLESPHRCCIKSNSFNDKGSNFIDQYSHEKRDDEMKCSEQYFKRVVYSYNSCGLQFKFPEDTKKLRKNVKPKSEKPVLNPFMKVVVYGTDPCALNFPVELGVAEANSEDKAFKATSDVKMSENSYNADLLGNICHNSDVMNVIYNDSSTNDNSTMKTFINKINSSEANFFKLKGDSDNLFLGHSVEKYQSSNVSAEKYLNDVNTDDMSFKTSMNHANIDSYPSSTFCTDGSDPKIRLPQIQSYSNNKLVPVSSTAKVPSLHSIINFDDYNDTFLPHLANCFEDSYQSNYPSSGKLVKFSPYENFARDDLDDSIPIYKSKRAKRKRRTQFSSRRYPSFPKARAFRFSDGSEILLNESSSDLNFSKSTATLIEPIELPFIVHGCLYIIIFVFFVISILLIQDTLKLAMAPDQFSSVPKDSYFEWPNYHNI